MDIAKNLKECFMALKEGRPTETIRLAEKIIRVKPDLGIAYLLTGRAFFGLNRLDEAIHFLRLATDKDPSSAESHVSLATALRVAGHIGEAYGEFVAALELSPTDTGIQCKTADFLLEQGQLDEAEQFFRFALTQSDPRAFSGLAAVLERRGDFAGALELLEECPSVTVGLGMAITRARLLWRLHRGWEAAALLESVDKSAVPPVEKAGCYHLLGDIFHDLSEYDQAFAAYSMANQQRHLHYDYRAESSRVDRIIAEFDRERLRSKAQIQVAKPPHPVFIVGVPRSGTSLLEQIISCHPAVHAAGELEEINRIAGAIDLDSQDSLSEAAERYLAPLRKLAPGVIYITDKMPHNFLHLGLIAMLFPSARVIHCVRDNLDTGLSLFRRNFNAMHTYASDLKAIGHFITEQRRLMKHWQEVLPLPILTVCYEELVTEPERVVGEVLELMSLDWDPDLLRFHESDRLVRTASYDQVRQPLHSSAVGCAESYNKYLGELQNVLATGLNQNSANESAISGCSF